MITAFNCHNSAGIWLNVGVLHIPTALGVNQTHPRVFPWDNRQLVPIVVMWLHARPEAGHLPTAWFLQLFKHSSNTAWVSVCPYSLGRKPELQWIKCGVSSRLVIRFKAEVFWQVSWWQLQDVSWKCEPMNVASALSVAVLHVSATAGIVCTCRGSVFPYVCSYPMPSHSVCSSARALCDLAVT